MDFKINLIIAHSQSLLTTGIRAFIVWVSAIDGEHVAAVTEVTAGCVLGWGGWSFSIGEFGG